MNNPLGVSPSKWKQGTTRGKEKILLTSMGIKSLAFSVRPCSSVGRVTVDLIWRSWVRFPPRSKDFFFASCGSLFPFTRANLQWVIHGFNVPVNSKTAHPPWATPRHLTRVKLRTVGNLTQNEARPVGHLTFLSKRLSAVGSERISQFFHSAREPRSKVIALVDSTFCCYMLYSYIIILQNMLLFKVWSDDKVNKKFIVNENFTQLVAKGKR